MTSHAQAIVFDAPQTLSVRPLELKAFEDADVEVAVQHSGISTGTERLLWDGSMPPFPGLGYPLVPGYETVGQVVRAGPLATLALGSQVFVPGSYSFQGVRNIFGGAGARLIVPQDRVVPVAADLGPKAVLLALAATCYHAIAIGGQRQPLVAPGLIVGHGVMGRLLARITLALGMPAPTVWEQQPARQGGASGYAVVAADRRPPQGLRRRLRRQRRRQPAQQPDRPPGTGRRGGAGRFLQGRPGLCLCAGLHARGQHPHRVTVEEARPAGRDGPGGQWRAVAGRPDHPHPGPGPGAGRLCAGLWRPAVPEDDAGLAHMSPPGRPQGELRSAQHGATPVAPQGAAQRVLVLGATGTIGQATVRALRRHGHAVVCFVRPQAGPGGRLARDDIARLLPGATLRFGDVTSAASLAQDAFCGEPFDALVSCLASRTGAPQDAWAIDHQAHLQALAAAKQAGVAQMVLLSAICVQKPLLAFQQAKLAFEQALQQSGITWSIVRPTAFFKSLSGQVARVQQGKPFLLFGDGTLTACKPISDDDLGDYLAGCLTRHQPPQPGAADRRAGPGA